MRVALAYMETPHLVEDLSPTELGRPEVWGRRLFFRDRDRIGAPLAQADLASQLGAAWERKCTKLVE